MEERNPGIPPSCVASCVAQGIHIQRVVSETPGVVKWMGPQDDMQVFHVCHLSRKLTLL